MFLTYLDLGKRINHGNFKGNLKGNQNQQLKVIKTQHFNGDKKKNETLIKLTTKHDQLKKKSEKYNKTVRKIKWKMLKRCIKKR